MGRLSRRLWLMIAATAAVVALCAAPAAAVDAPHIVGETETDVCAMCHRAHTPASETSHTVWGSLEMTGSALILGNYEDGDSGLCYACHGVGALGSGTDVETAFLSGTQHSLSPSSSEYGPTQKYCSSCHDSHGTERLPSGDPYPALLRSTSVTDTTVLHYSGDDYCASCHQDRPADVWGGLEVWSMTAHSAEITPPASGTGIVCSVCHDPHGSDNPPLIVEQLIPPAVPATVTVTPDGRSLCLGCHPGPEATFSGSAKYATSGHGSSDESIAVAAEWASAETTRAVGECENCHNPMGVSDGAGGILPKLVTVSGRTLCDGCHSASGIATDLASFAFPPSEATDAELFVTYDPGQLPTAYGRAALYTQETTGAAPRDLIGPREYGVTGRAGDASAGDIDADGSVDVVVADPGATRLEVFSFDPLKGLAEQTYAIGIAATWVDVADVILDGTGRPEIAVVTRAAVAPNASDLYLYRWSAGSLSLVTGPVSVGNDASGIASGDVTGTVAADLAVTALADNQLRILTESTSTPGTLVTGGPYATRKGPRGPSIGDAWDGASVAREVVVANYNETVGTVSVFSGAGALLGSYDATGTAGARAYDTLVNDLLPNVAGNETVVALRHEDSTSSVNTFARLAGGGLGSRQDYATGTRYRTSSLAAGDLDGDDAPELVAGNAGAFLRSANSRASSVQVFDVAAGGTALVANPATRWAGGVELAGSAPGLVVADLGGIGESRHPVGAVEGTHNSTETAVLVRHVECVDCHNVHEATSTPTVASATPPSVYGRLAGAWGVQVTNAPVGTITLAERQGVLYEYEVCMKCHSQWSDLEGGRDIASEFDTRNVSFHGVEAAPVNASNTLGSFVATSPAWTSTSIMYCVDCHANADAIEARGPHTSQAAPVLVAPVWGAKPDVTGLLCYRCHKSSVYLTGTDDVLGNTPATNSNFYDASPSYMKLHNAHSGTNGIGCGACHAAHGSAALYHTLRGDIGFTHTSNGGSCNVACHADNPRVYTRTAETLVAASYTLTYGTVPAADGNLASTYSIDGAYLQIVEQTDNVNPAILVEFSFSNASVPTSVTFRGRYARVGAPLTFQAYNWATGTWTTIGTLTGANADSTVTYAIPVQQRDYVRGGQVRVRMSALPRNNSRTLWIDYLAVNH